MNKPTNQSGFTLIEMLVVIAVIGIIAAIGVPRYVSAKRAANQASSVESLRLITSGEITYTHGIQLGNFASLGTLGDEKLIDTILSAGGGSATDTSTKSGYEFHSTTIAPTATEAAHFVISAVPTNTLPVFQTGNNRYGVDDTYVLYTDINNLGTHYNVPADLHSGTSQVFSP